MELRWNTKKHGYTCRRNARKSPRRVRADLFASTKATTQGYLWQARIGRGLSEGYATSPAMAISAAEACVYAYDTTTAS